MVFVIIGIVSLVIILGLIWLTRRDAMHRGEDKADKEAMQEIIDDVFTANQIRDMLNRNPDLARRVRERFTRD